MTWGALDVALFGAGGDEPYASVLTAKLRGRLAMHRAGELHATVEWDVAEWFAPTTCDDDAVLSRLEEPLLDVGCGPGRMVRAATARSISALGVDVSPIVARMAAAAGVAVLCRSVFDPLPLEGQWQSILLMDGNVGIGGDPAALLRRCAELLGPGGVVVVEVDLDPDLWDCDVFTVIGGTGLESAPFPWARVGGAALGLVAAAAGLVVSDRWEGDARSFVMLRRAGD